VIGLVDLKHRRLAAIHLNSANRQPVINEDSMVWILFTGEIHRFCELQVDLETEEVVCDELLTWRREAVKLRLIGHDPVSDLLSWGNGSGTIVPLMAALGAVPTKTFPIGFEEKRYDELPCASLLAEDCHDTLWSVAS
jgi:asparagine synthase (glutamine-hydrolysing)